jgi:hypothetical protein
MKLDLSLKKRELPSSDVNTARSATNAGYAAEAS